MAITYENFEAYPLQIIGINDTYDDELTAIEAFVIDEIDYSGVAEDLDAVLPYFVFFLFCESRESVVFAEAGESQAVKEFTMPARNSQVRAWNIGAKKLAALCVEKTETASASYQSQISFI
jgi:hypothetical protein